jgi:WD40 repeat protein
MVKIVLVWKKEIIPIETESNWSVNRLKVEICLLTGVATFEQKLQGLTSAADNGETLLSRLNLHNNHKVLLIQQREVSKTIVSRFEDEDKENMIIDATANDVFSLVPQELSIEIFMLLSVPTILGCRLVSKFWKSAVASQTLWIKQFHKNWGSLLEFPNQDSKKDWRGVFAAKLACERNWLIARYEKIPRSLTTQDINSGPVSCVKFYDKYFSTLIYGEGRSIIWEKSTQSGFSARKLIAHKSSISTLHYNNSSPLIFSGDVTGNVVLWDTRVEGNILPWETKSSEFIGMLPAHNNSILGLATNEDFMFTHDKNFIKIWDLNEMRLTQQISFSLPPYVEIGENETIDFGAMQFRRDEIIASNGKIINGWDTRTGKSSISIMTSSHVSSLQMVKDHFLMSSHELEKTIVTRDLRFPSEKPVKVLVLASDQYEVNPGKFMYDGFKTIVLGDGCLFAVYHGEGPKPEVDITQIFAQNNVFGFDCQSTSLAVASGYQLVVCDFKKSDKYLDEYYSNI